MNIPNNKRKKESQEKIEKVFIELIQNKPINEITVTDICKQTKLNRSTFYANYLDVYDLADKIRGKLELEVTNLYAFERETETNTNDFLKLFTYIKENQLFFNTYFKLSTNDDNYFYEYDYNLSEKLYDDKHIDYHICFFKAGLNAIIRKWLNSGCKETPQEMFDILKSEYNEKD